MPSDTQTEFNGVIVRLRAQGESAMFPGIVKEALAKINSKPVGRKLLKGIHDLASRAKFGYTVAIMRPDGLAIEDKSDGKGPQWNGGSVAIRISEKDACDGTGTPTKVVWNANIIETPDGSRPAFIALAHELIHAFNNLQGSAYSDTATEEYATVGLAPLANLREVNENNIRREHGVPHRSQYGGLAPPASVVAK